MGELLIFICGDFNSSNNRNSKLYSSLFNDESMVDGLIINDQFVDCTRYCKPNCQFTYHAFKGMECPNKHGFIDWILCSKNVIESNAIKMKEINVITEKEFAQGLPSDHYPVMLKFDIDSSKCQAPQTSECSIQ